MNSLPTLYKKTRTGKIQVWSIRVEDSTLITDFGQDGGAIQTATDVITKGKNIGRSNETTPVEQAVAEATSRWEKQIKDGYVDDREKAMAGIEAREGVRPMLAHVWEKQSAKMPFPCYTQPKLDGLRCIAIIRDGHVTLQTRNLEIVEALPHINMDLAVAFDGIDIILDGELYNPSIPFEKITSLVRKQKGVNPDYKLVQYHVYDVVASPETFVERFVDNQEMIKRIFYSEYCHVVQTEIANSLEELMVHYADFKNRGYEGAMARNPETPYTGTRNYGLLKLKDFIDAEFEIIDVVSGRGKLEGMGIFVCRTESGKEFSVKMVGELESLREYLTNKNNYVGKMLTVKFQNYTDDGLPRFPVALRVHPGM